MVGMPDSPVPSTRRARRQVERRRAERARRVAAWIVGGVLAVGGSVAVSSALAGATVAPDERIGTTDAAEPDVQAAAELGITALPAPVMQSDVAETTASDATCEQSAVTDALESGSDADVIAAFGGADAFRTAVSGGDAPCIDLAEAGRIWVVVNKHQALDPIDYWPVPQARADGVQRTSGGHMRADVADALEQLASAAANEVGAIGVNSGFRSYEFQIGTYNGYVDSLGRESADLTSARPGHSEHQTGLAVDVIACSNGCGGIERFGSTAQADWVAENAWRFGFIVRYESGQTGTTGYEWEPWHLRYIGTDLAAAYHDGGFHTLEDFFGLDPAPDYLD